MTRILISISITYLLTTLPYAVYTVHRSFLAIYVFKAYSSATVQYHTQYTISSLANRLGILLFNINSAINFWLYIVTGSTFRDELSKMFYCYKSKPEIPVTSSSIPTIVDRIASSAPSSDKATSSVLPSDKVTSSVLPSNKVISSVHAF